MKHYTIGEIELMRKYIEILYWEEHYTFIQQEAKLRTYMRGGVTIKELKREIVRQIKEMKNSISESPPSIGREEIENQIENLEEALKEFEKSCKK